MKNRRSNRVSMVGIGLRELTSGVAILSRSKTTGVWLRVAGDLMDLALLRRSLAPHRFASRRSMERRRIIASAAAVGGITLVDGWTALRLSASGDRGRALDKRGAIRVTKAITVNVSPELVYAFWRDLENLPRFMAHLESVLVRDGLSRWRARGPAGSAVEWEAAIVADRPNEVIAWRSVEGSQIINTGAVRFRPAPGGRGTEVSVDLLYHPPAGALGAKVAKLFGEEPSQQIAADLRRFKQVVETGEVVQSDASIHRGMHPARPSREPRREARR